MITVALFSVIFRYHILLEEARYWHAVAVVNYQEAATQYRMECTFRSFAWARTHAHPAIEFDRCRRRSPRSVCIAEREALIVEACRTILQEGCAL